MFIKLQRENPPPFEKGKTLKTEVATEILRNCFFAEKNSKILITKILCKLS